MQAFTAKHSGEGKIFLAPFLIRQPYGETFYSLEEAQILIERWRVHYSTEVTQGLQGPSDRQRSQTAPLFP
jgi:hypothetical protein